VNLGAVRGQVAGAFYGDGALPVEWRTQLVAVADIEALAEALLDLARSNVS
jgi:ADP-ribosyl-[dinitrogen reductase] hydrolase